VSQSSLDNAERIAAKYEKSGLSDKAQQVRKAIELAKAGKVKPDDFHNLFESELREENE